jgi:hypothetical protein
MPKILHYTQNISLILWLIVVSQHQFRLLLSQSTLQETQYLVKQSKYYLNAIKSKVDIQKSLKKLSKALKIYSTRVLLSAFQLRYCSFFNQNQAL